MLWYLVFCIKWDGLSSGVEINAFMFRFTLCRVLSRGGDLSSEWPLKRGSSVYIKMEPALSNILFLSVITLWTEGFSGRTLRFWRMLVRSGTFRVPSCRVDTMWCARPPPPGSCTRYTLKDFSPRSIHFLKKKDISRRPIDRLEKNRRVRSRWFDRMKFAPIIFQQSFRSHCQTVGPNLTGAIENYLWSSDQSLTWQTTADYHRLSFSPVASSPTARFFIRFSIQPSDPPISRPMGCWL